MISVIEVYNAVRDLANKDQKGFVTPTVFNSFAEIAQEKIFSKVFENLIQAKALRMGQRDPGAGESIYKGAQDDLSSYIREQRLLGSNDPNFTGDSNMFKKPFDFYKLISIRVDGDERTPVEIVYRPDQMSHIVASNLSSPTELFPVALVSNSIEVFPSDVGGVIMTYYRYPASKYVSTSGLFIQGEIDYSSSPRFSIASEDSNGYYVPDTNNSRNFDLPSRFKDDIVAEICEMIGVRLRDTVLIQYGQTQDN